MKYYSARFEESDVPSLERVDYMGYKFGEVIDPSGFRTFKEAKSAHRRNLLRMIELCQKELKRIPSITPDSIEQTEIW